jgi:hypothetical protein
MKGAAKRISNLSADKTKITPAEDDHWHDLLHFLALRLRDWAQRRIMLNWLSISERDEPSVRRYIQAGSPELEIFWDNL